jgi:hypothetical protein
MKFSKSFAMQAIFLTVFNSKKKKFLIVAYATKKILVAKT